MSNSKKIAEGVKNSTTDMPKAWVYLERNELINKAGSRRDVTIEGRKTWGKILTISLAYKNECDTILKCSNDQCAVNEALICCSLLDSILGMEQGAEEYDMYVNAFQKAVDKFEEISLINKRNHWK